MENNVTPPPATNTSSSTPATPQATPTPSQAPANTPPISSAPTSPNPVSSTTPIMQSSGPHAAKLIVIGLGVINLLLLSYIVFMIVGR